MSDGPEQQAYNPLIQGGMGGGGDAASGGGIGGGRMALLGGVNDTQSAVPGAGIQHVMGFMSAPKAGVNSFISNKGPRTLSKGLSALGIRTQVQWDSSIQDQTGGVGGASGQEIHGEATSGGDGGGSYDQAIEAGSTILQNGAYMGGLSEAFLTGAAAISPPATPGMSAERGVGMEM